MEGTPLGVAMQSAWSQFGSKGLGQAITHCELLLSTHLLPRHGDVPTQREGDTIPGCVMFLREPGISIRLCWHSGSCCPELYSHRFSVPKRSSLFQLLVDDR